jgi:hypothetical protein
MYIWRFYFLEIPKAKLKIGEFARGGKNRVPIKTGDHDFKVKTVVTPYGILIPDYDELFYILQNRK